jgi:hypothetical protein
MVTEGEWGKVKKRYLTWLMQEKKNRKEGKVENVGCGT